MSARAIFAVVAVVFLSLAAIRRTGPGVRLQRRIWLLIGLVFAVVSAWLFYQP